jgi:hypothetical protein
VAVLSVVLERLDVGRDMAAVVDIRWGLEEEGRGDIEERGDTFVDFGVDGVLTFKRDEATDGDFPAVLCDRAELADDRDLALEVDPVREERVDREATLAKDARVIKTFLIVVC